MNSAPTPGVGERQLPFGFGDVAAFLDRAVDAGGERTRAAPAFADIVADLSRLGLPPGTAVIIALSNGRRLLQHYFAALLTGAVPLLVSPATTAARIAGLAQRVGAGAVVAQRLEPHRYGVDAVVPVGDAHAAVLYPPASLLEPGMVLMLTSGTSGMFSACLHRVGSLLRNARRHAKAVGLRSADTVLVNLPLFYSYAIVAQAFAALVVGARLVITGPPFSPAPYLDDLARYDVAASSVTPTIARLLLAHGARLPRTLRLLTVGGDSIAARHVAELLAANPHLELYVTYGLTEAGPRVATLAAHREPVTRHRSVGLPLPGVTTSLRGPFDKDGSGELLVASDTVLVANVGDTQARRTLIAPGVVATGDRFRMDGDGYLYFEGRLSDFIVAGGEKVSLSAVREFVQALPGVLRCTTRVEWSTSGAVGFDLDVQVNDDPSGAEQRIRRAISSFLLPAERPRDVSVRQRDPSIFQK